MPAWFLVLLIGAIGLSCTVCAYDHYALADASSSRLRDAARRGQADPNVVFALQRETFANIEALQLIAAQHNFTADQARLALQHIKESIR